MTVANLYVKCFHGKKLSNTDDVSSGSGYAASVGVCHLDISWHHTETSTQLIFPLPSKHRLIFLECTAGEFLMEISLLCGSQHENPSPVS